MSMIDICRVCLNTNRRMYAVNKTRLQEIWERLTNARFNIGDGKPHLVCYMCCAHLKKSYELMMRALRAEESLMMALINNGLEMSNPAHELDYNYVSKLLNCDEYKQLEVDGFEEIEKKNEVESKGSKDEEAIIYVKIERDDKEYENDIQIKKEDVISGENCFYFEEEKEDLPGSSYRGNHLEDVKTEICPDDNEPFRILSPENILGKVEVVLEEVDEVSTIKRKLNKAPRKAKLKEKKEDRNNVLNKNRKCKASDASNLPMDISNEGNKINGVSENGFSCHMCRFKCLSKDELNIHLQKHTGDKTIMCDLCEFRCSNKRYLRKHMQYKHTKEKKFSCHLCQYRCVEKYTLNVHLRKHTEVKPYICDLCDYRCAQRNALKRHLRFKHIKEKNFSCHICQYKCVEKSRLNIHLRTHTDYKPYNCHFCDYRCSYKVGLKNHIQYKHTKEKNFSCHLCEYKCVKKDDLNRHIRRHTGEKPFKCEHCDYRCVLRSGLNLHIKAKHAT